MSALSAIPNIQIDLNTIPEANRACLQRIASLRGVTVAELVAAMVREETTRILAQVAGFDPIPPQPTHQNR